MSKKTFSHKLVISLVALDWALPNDGSHFKTPEAGNITATQLVTVSLVHIYTVTEILLKVYRTTNLKLL